MTTIDHAAEARALWDNLHEWQEQEGDTDETRLVQAIEAHAHETAAATLALVEQQRIANLIALGTPRPVPTLGHDAEVWISAFEDDGTLRDDIKKGLGL